MSPRSFGPNPPTPSYQRSVLTDTAPNATVSLYCASGSCTLIECDSAPLAPDEWLPAKHSAASHQSQLQHCLSTIRRWHGSGSSECLTRGGTRALPLRVVSCRGCNRKVA